MNYSKDEVMQYVREEDVKFIRLAFCDVYGRQKNISIMPEELPRAFRYGIAFDASAVPGFADVARSDLFLHPDPGTLALLPWRPEHGKVVRMYSSITYPDGSLYECDTRSLLIKAAEEAAKAGYSFYFGSEQEFYLFELDENGEPTKIPYDKAGYMDIAPDDRGENIRREICLTLEQMGIRPESSMHEEGPGQNEIDFRYSDAVSAADNAQTFHTVVRTVARRNGVHADFTPKPLEDKAGNGFHINMSAEPAGEPSNMGYIIAGILEKIREMTLFFNPTEDSYKRFGIKKAPAYISWSKENRSQLVRIPAALGEYRRVELRSPDPTANPYLAFTLMIHAALYGIKNKLALPPSVDVNLFTAGEDVLKNLQTLPRSRKEAAELAAASSFIREHIPEQILDVYCGNK